MEIIEGYKEFLQLRRYVIDSLSKIDMSLGHKSYEGTFELVLAFPGYFDDGSDKDLPDFVKINLHCYVLGPNRHYDWIGKNIHEAVKKCRCDVDRWIKEELECEE